MKQRPQLLFLNNQGLGPVGGGVAILRALCADLSRDHGIRILCDDPPVAAADGVQQVQLPAFAPPAGAGWRLKPLLKARHLARCVDAALLSKADTVVVLDPHFAWAVGRLPRRRLLFLSLSCVARQEWFGGGGVSRFWYPWQYAWLERRLARQAALTLVASEMHGREMQRFSGVPAARLRVLPPVLSPAQPPQAGAASPRRAGLLAVGRITPVKNLAALFPVLAELPGLHLTLLGDGDDPGALQTLARACGVADRVHWLGAVSDPAPWLDGGLLLLHPSRYESFGMAVYEAMARGLIPVVYAPGPGRRTAGADLVQDGVNGLAVDFSQPAAAAARILALLQRPGECAAMSERAMATASRFEGYRYTARFREVLQTMEAGR